MLNAGRMKPHLKFFIIVAVLAAVLHYLLVQGLSRLLLSQSAFSGPPSFFAAFVVPLFLSCLTAPMNFLLSSAWERTLSPTPFLLLFTMNSVLWGVLIGAGVLWLKLRYE
jgi:hypothetical protein